MNVMMKKRTEVRQLFDTQTKTTKEWEELRSQLVERQADTKEEEVDWDKFQRDWKEQTRNMQEGVNKVLHPDRLTTMLLEELGYATKQPGGQGEIINVVRTLRQLSTYFNEILPLYVGGEERDIRYRIFSLVSFMKRISYSLPCSPSDSHLHCTWVKPVVPLPS